MKRNQEGFSLLEVIAVVAVVALVAFAGWRLYEARDDQDGEVSDNYPTIESQDDLGEAAGFLMEVDIDSDLDTSELDEVISGI